MRLSNVFDADGELPAGTAAWMSTRQGGHGRAPWDSFNLGDHVGDDPAVVQANRQQLADTLGARPVFLRQVHGRDVVAIDHATPDGAVADACYTFTQGLACTVMVADCLPVLLWDLQGRWVAAAHAGWRGLAGEGGVGVLEALWSELTLRGASAPNACAWLGPCIGPQAFEVGPEVYQAFGGAAHAALFKRGQGDRWLADLPGLARTRLRALGLTHVKGNDGTQAWCTVSRPALFFSHRREAARLGSTGRMAASIWLC